MEAVARIDRVFFKYTCETVFKSSTTMREVKKADVSAVIRVPQFSLSPKDNVVAFDAISSAPAFKFTITATLLYDNFSKKSRVTVTSIGAICASTEASAELIQNGYDPMDLARHVAEIARKKIQSDVLYAERLIGIENYEAKDMAHHMKIRFIESEVAVPSPEPFKVKKAYAA